MPRSGAARAHDDLGLGSGGFTFGRAAGAGFPGVDDALGPPRYASLLPRSLSSLSQAEEENGQSRIYLGIHWNFDKA